MYLSDDLRGLAGTNIVNISLGGQAAHPPSLIRHKNAATRLERPPFHGETISGGDQQRCRQLILLSQQLAEVFSDFIDFFDNTYIWISAHHIVCLHGEAGLMAFLH
jgi:hypothetical protein